MGDPPFSSLFEWALYLSSKAYRLAVRLRILLYQEGFIRQKGLPSRVLSVGNITAGGTGKTPMVEHVASLLRRFQLDVAIISRGYGGTAQRSGGVVSNGKAQLLGAVASGDEPQVLCSRLEGVPLLIGKDRYRVGREAVERFGSSVLVLDDAFQHLPLKRDLDLLLLDSDRPFGNGYCIPRGMLREPVEQIKRASAFILTRWTGDAHQRAWRSVIEARADDRPIFRCRHVPDKLFVAGTTEMLDLDYLKGERLFLFSGIVRNDSFLKTVSGLGGSVAGFLEFPDHHRYSDNDLNHIWNRAKALKVQSVITTEKDYMNILKQIPPGLPLLVLGITISFGEDSEAFESFIGRWISSSSSF